MQTIINNILSIKAEDRVNQLNSLLVLILHASESLFIFMPVLHQVTPGRCVRHVELFQSNNMSVQSSFMFLCQQSVYKP